MNYKIVKYSEIGKIRSGKRLPKGYTVSEKISNNKYIRVRDINSGSIDSSIVQYITDEAAEKLERYKVKTRDVIISVVGTVGAIAQIDESLNGAYLTENCDNLQVDESLCLKDYLKYYLLSEDGSKEIIANTVGSTQPKLPIYGIENFNIKLPSIDNQKRIVKLLNSIDKKIKLNNEINNNLYEVSLSIFNDFLNNNDAELIRLEDCVEKINTGADAIQRAPIVDYDTGVRCIRIGDMTNGRDYHNWGFTKMNDKDYDNYKLIKNDIVVTRTAVNGLTYIITDEERVVCNNGNIRLRVNNKYNPLYIYLNTKTKDFRNYIDRINGETSVRPNMKVEYFTSYEIKKYSLEEQNKICNVINPLFNKINENKKENYNLEQLRDTLLPKLMNGEIDLANIEI